jgi:ribosomal protein L24E
MMYIFRTGKINYYCSGRCYKYDIVMHRKLKKKAKVTIAARPTKPEAQKPETPKQKT